MLLDQFLPNYDVHKAHAIEVEAPVERVYRALHAADVAASRIIRCLFLLRGLTPLVQPHAVPPRRQVLTLDDFLHNGFTLLGSSMAHHESLGFLPRPRSLLRR